MKDSSPHAHYINQTPDGKYITITDLGADRIVTYKFDDNGFEFYKESYLKIVMGQDILNFMIMENLLMSYTNYQIL